MVKHIVLYTLKEGVEKAEAIRRRKTVAGLSGGNGTSCGKQQDSLHLFHLAALFLCFTEKVYSIAVIFASAMNFNRILIFSR